MVTPELALQWAPPDDPSLPAMLSVLRDDAQYGGDLAMSILDVLFRHWENVEAYSDDHDSIPPATTADVSWAHFGVLFVSLDCMLRFNIEAVVERFAVSHVATKRIVDYVGGRGLPAVEDTRNGVCLRNHFVTHVHHLVCAMADSAPSAALLLTHHVLSAALLAPMPAPAALLLRLSQHSSFFAAFAAIPDAALIAFLNVPSMVSTLLPVLYALIREGSQCQRLLDHQVLPLLLDEAEKNGTPEALDAVLHLAVVVDDPSEIQLVARAPQLVQHVVDAESGFGRGAQMRVSTEWRSCLRYKLTHFLHIAGRVFTPHDLMTWVEHEHVQQCIREVLRGHNQEEHVWIMDFLAACALKRPLHGSPQLDSLLLSLDTYGALTLTFVPGRALILFWLAHTRHWATTRGAAPHGPSTPCALFPVAHPLPEALRTYLPAFTAFDALRVTLDIPIYRRLISLVADTFVHLSTANSVEWPSETLPVLLPILSLGGACAQQWVESNIARLPPECDSMLLPWLSGPYCTTVGRRLAQRGLALDDAHVGAVAKALPEQERGTFVAQRVVSGSSGIALEHVALLRDNLQWVFPHVEGDAELALEEFLVAGAEPTVLNDDQLFALLTMAWEKKRWGRVLRDQAERARVRPPSYIADIMAFLVLHIEDVKAVTTSLLPRYESSVPFWVLRHPASPCNGSPFGRLLIRLVARISALWPYVELCVSLTGVPTELFDDKNHAMQFLRTCVKAARDDGIPHAMGALLAAFARPSLDHWLTVDGRIGDEFVCVLEHVAQHEELHAEHAARAKRLLAMAAMVEEDSHAASVTETNDGADKDTTDRSASDNERVVHTRLEEHNRSSSSMEYGPTSAPAAISVPPHSASSSPENAEKVLQSDHPTSAMLPSAFLCHRIAHKTELPKEHARHSPRRANVSDIMASLVAQSPTAGVSHPVPAPRAKVDRTAEAAGDTMEGTVTLPTTAHHKQDGSRQDDDILPALMHGLLSAAHAAGGVNGLSAPLCTAVEESGATGNAVLHEEHSGTINQGVPMRGVRASAQNAGTMTHGVAPHMRSSVHDEDCMTDGVNEMGQTTISNIVEEEKEVEALQAELERLERELAELESGDP